ncbi:MAG: ribonuclease H-like domain-containing protein [Actinomycetota bacterium]
MRTVSDPTRTVDDIDITAPLIGLDIETDTTIDGLDPRQSAVLAVAVSGAGHDVVIDGPDESSILRRVDELLASIPHGILVTWNGSGFDLPFIAARAAVLGLSLGLVTRHDPRMPGRHDPLPGEPGRVRGRWHALRHLDGYQPYRSDVGHVLSISCGLKSLAKLAGLEVVEVDRSRIHELTPAEMHDYVLSDARLARELVERRVDRFAWIDQDPSASG